ncbi:hypothetical protein M406DRAFT_68784 [Cryphonectria parasitica EP155]|uniref:Uncharacterized protein n=1 Tax=Cryphonectria parasitica (strain ATCC 38755 / EP155) TaxID=660469 RepID=A0A9P5CPG1_CRYP1|nr:uncharacterized protein M406DRAFT_68784 [Cryphonectria parasitica EP155]KAF3766444.1 hypothetical protein M406DRAFT_68784 [Cryphonectria parasitica EP155]
MSSSAKQSVRMQFLCEKRQLDFHEEVPKSLIGPEALTNPAMPKMFEMTMAPVIKKHAGEALGACEAKCSAKSCERPSSTVVATPMSYLHKVDDPFVIIMTVACCNSPACDITLKQEARHLMLQVAQERTQSIASFGVPPMSRGAKCYCGSGRKFKKCCGKEEGKDEEEEEGADAAAAAVAA